MADDPYIHDRIKALSMDEFPELKMIIDSLNDVTELKEFANINGIADDPYVLYSIDNFLTEPTVKKFKFDNQYGGQEPVKPYQLEKLKKMFKTVSAVDTK